MRAIIKSSKRIVLKQIDPSERALIEDYITAAETLSTNIMALFDIDNELDGVSFELGGNKKQIKYTEPTLQILSMEGSTTIDLKVDENTSITLDTSECEPYILAHLTEDKKISITSTYQEHLVNKTVKYNLNARLTKENCDPAIVPIQIMVVYISSNLARDYETLVNLPKINHRIVLGDKYPEDYNLMPLMDRIGNDEIDDLFEEVDNNG